MDVRYAVHPDHAMALDNKELRVDFQRDKLFNDIDLIDTGALS